MMTRAAAAALFAGLAALAGCVAAPVRAVPSVAQRSQRKAAPADLRVLSLTVVLTQNSRTAADYVERYAQTRAGMASDAEAGHLFTDILAAFSERFGRVRVLETGSPSPQDGDLVATLDVYAAFANSIFGSEKIDVTVDLAGSDGRLVDRLQSRVKKRAGPSSVSDAVKQSVAELKGFLDASQPLAAVAASARPRPAAVAAAPAPSPEPAPAPAAEPATAPRRSAVDEPSYKHPEDPTRFAVVVGVEKYETLPAADYAENDARAVRAHLLALGYPERNIIFLRGSQAGKAGLEKNLDAWLPRNVDENSKVLFYFSGHGAPDPVTGQAYLMPWDGDAKFVATTGYGVKRLYERLDSLKAKEVVVALDACFSGAGGRSVMARGARPLVTKVDVGDEGAGRVTGLAAAGPDEITGTDEGQAHGLFTYHLLSGLNVRSGKASLRELFEFLSPKVRDAARRDNRDQTPRLIGPESGARLPLR